MLNDGFTAAEGAGDRRHSAASNGKERINNALTRYHRICRGKLFPVRSAAADRPLSQHTYRLFAALSFDNSNSVLDSKLSLFYLFNLAANTVGHQNSVFYKLGFLHGAEYISLDDLAADLYEGHKFPFFFTVEIIYRNTPRNSCAVLEIQRCKRPLNSVEDARNKPGRKLGRERLSRRHDLFTRSQSCRFFIDLN